MFNKLKQPMPIYFKEYSQDSFRVGFKIHDLPEEKWNGGPVLTMWKLSFWGRIRTLLTGKIATVVWDKKNPLMSVENV